jgi:hypothetical protein
MTVKLITLKTNHTLIGKVDEEGNFNVKIKQPVQVVVQPTKDGPMMGFVPFVDFSEDFKTGFTISNSDILFTSLPVRELENQYNKMFGSGIEIASSIPKL